jgi:hypothetical protein
VSVEGLSAAALAGIGRINDGIIDVRDNSGRWLSPAHTPPLEIVFAWSEPRTFNTVGLISGYAHGGLLTAPVECWSVHIERNGAWEEIPGAAVADSAEIGRHISFDSRTSRKLMLRIDKCGRDRIARIWEAEIYNRP